MRNNDEIDDWIDLRFALKCLTPRQSQALLLKCQGFTQAETGELMGVSQVAIHKLLNRTLEYLQGVIKQGS